MTATIYNYQELGVTRIVLPENISGKASYMKFGCNQRTSLMFLLISTSIVSEKALFQARSSGEWRQEALSVSVRNNFRAYCAALVFVNAI
eukprot:snap_masked-scaffold_14-processed-gene-5.31-mRNA-1 protein AED:1.00 eAED:1.00 QI:0/-1/0/0/-1/1/1/0/89